MQLDDMVLFSVDDHVIEPRGIFDGREPAEYAGRFPRLLPNEENVETWQWEAPASGSASLNAVVTWPKDQWSFDPTTHAEMRPGCYDLDRRIDDMNVNGVAVSMCFPTFPRFGGGLFNACEDKGLALAVTQAYNDWHIDEWCARYPGRFMPLAIPAAWDPELSAAEVKRVAAKGCPSTSGSAGSTRTPARSKKISEGPPF